MRPSLGNTSAPPALTRLMRQSLRRSRSMGGEADRRRRVGPAAVESRARLSLGDRRALSLRSPSPALSRSAGERRGCPLHARRRADRLWLVERIRCRLLPRLGQRWVQPPGVAVDPNSGGVYATSETQLAVRRMDPGLGNPNAYGGQPPSTEGNLPLPCFSCSNSEEFRIAGNPPLSVAVDCRSDLYVLTNANARAVVKYINQDYVPPSRCSPLLQRLATSPGIRPPRGRTPARSA
jgi:hypothetical protein